MRLGERVVGADAPVLLIAALGPHHHGDRDKALALVDLAAAAGADAVRVDSFGVLTKPVLRLHGADRRRIERLALPVEWHAPLRDRAHAKGLVFLATPYDECRARVLAALGTPAAHVRVDADTPVGLLRRIGSFGRPILLDVGSEPAAVVAAALAAVVAGAGETTRQPEVALLVGGDVALFEHWRGCHQGPVGWVDRVADPAAALAVVAGGAALLECGLRDGAASADAGDTGALDPRSFAVLTRAIREMEAMRRSSMARSGATS